MKKTCTYLTKRSNGVFYYSRRYPKSILHFFNASLYRKSLKTDNMNLAVSRYEAVHLATQLEWERLKIEGSDEHADKLYAVALDKAQSLNMNYLTNSELLKKDLVEEVMKRISYLRDKNIAIDDLTARTVIGAINRPVVTIENALEIYLKILPNENRLVFQLTNYVFGRAPEKEQLLIS